jgi:hypothetical protein
MECITCLCACRAERRRQVYEALLDPNVMGSIFKTTVSICKQVRFSVFCDL